MPSHFIGIFSLGPCILFYFFRCLTPPPLATDEGHISSHFPPHFAQTQLGHLRDAYGKTLKILGAAPVAGAAGSEAAGALLEPLAPEVGTSMP